MNAFLLLLQNGSAIDGVIVDFLRCHLRKQSQKDAPLISNLSFLCSADLFISSSNMNIFTGNYDYGMLLFFSHFQKYLK